MKKNCWEVKACGREIGGKNVASLGVCPAATDKRLHGVHGGKSAGRACWVLAGTLCGGKVQGSFGAKFGNCQSCEFYLSVKQDEGIAYQLSPVLLERLKCQSAAPASSATTRPASPTTRL